MEKLGWKILAIIEMIILLAWIGLAVYYYYDEKRVEKEQMQCFYEVFPYEDCYDVQYDPDYNLCQCINLDLLGNEQITKTEYMG